MGLCGGFRCGCGVTSTPATSGAIGGELPSINVTGSGEPGDPYDLTLNDAWAEEVASRLESQAGWEVLATGSGSGAGFDSINIDVPSSAHTWQHFELRVIGKSSATALQTLRLNGMGASQAHNGGTITTINGAGATSLVQDFQSVSTFRWAEWGTVDNNSATIQFYRNASFCSVMADSVRHSNNASTNRRFFANGRINLLTPNFQSVQLGCAASETLTLDHYVLTGLRL
jgi:hypothetical protein